MTLLWALVLLSLALAGGALFVAVQLLQQNGRILMRLDALEAAPAAAPGGAEMVYQLPSTGLRPGESAPDFELPDLFGGRRALSSLRDRPVLLVFFNPRCGYCLEMLPRLAALPWEHHGTGLAPLVVTTGTIEENRKLVQDHHLRCPVLLQEGTEVASAYAAVGTPTGYLIDADGRIASELAVGAEALLTLAGELKPERQRGNKPLSESRIPRDGLEPGTPAPEFRVPALRGGEMALEDWGGRPVLLVFSDPDCGPCLELAPELEQRHRRGGPAQVVMISRGTVEENRPKADQLGLTFPIGLQKRWEVSQQYAMFGTPIAYLIGPDGRTAAPPAVGLESILALYDGTAAALNGARSGKEVAQTA